MTVLDVRAAVATPHLELASALVRLGHERARQVAFVLERLHQQALDFGGETVVTLRPLGAPPRVDGDAVGLQGPTELPEEFDTTVSLAHPQSHLDRPRPEGREPTRQTKLRTKRQRGQHVLRDQIETLQVLGSKLQQGVYLVVAQPQSQLLRDVERLVEVSRGEQQVRRRIGDDLHGGEQLLVVEDPPVAVELLESTASVGQPVHPTRAIRHEGVPREVADVAPEVDRGQPKLLQDHLSKVAPADVHPQSQVQPVVVHVAGREKHLTNERCASLITQGEEQPLIVEQVVPHVEVVEVTSVEFLHRRTSRFEQLQERLRVRRDPPQALRAGDTLVPVGVGGLHGDVQQLQRDGTLTGGVGQLRLDVGVILGRSHSSTPILALAKEERRLHRNVGLVF